VRRCLGREVVREALGEVGAFAKGLVAEFEFSKKYCTRTQAFTIENFALLEPQAGIITVSRGDKFGWQISFQVISSTASWLAVGHRNTKAPAIISRKHFIVFLKSICS